MSRSSLLVALGLMAGCAAPGSTAAHSRRIAERVGDDSVRLRDAALRIGAPSEELPAWCSVRGRSTRVCQPPGRGAGWRAEVLLGDSGQIQTVELWRLQGPSEFTCRLMVSTAADLESLWGPGVWSKPCRCSASGCNLEGDAQVHWTRGSVAVTLSQTTDMDQPTAPDGTPISTISLDVSGQTRDEE